MTTPSLHPALAGQTVVILGGSSGIGLETAHQARSADARVIVTGRHRERLDRAARDVDAAGTAMLDLGRPAEIERFFTGLPAPVDHVLVSGGGPPMRHCATSTSTKPSASSTNIFSVHCGWPARASDGFDPAVH